MSRSVSFSDDVVSHVFYIPRIDEESKGDYFYSQREIERFQRIWQNAYMELVRRKEQEKYNSEAYSKRKHSEMGCTMSCGRTKRVDPEKDIKEVTPLPSKCQSH